MTNNKQSSVELFIEQLEEKGKAYEENQVVRTINICIDVSDYMELKVQAQAMHKKEIVDAYYVDNEKNEGFEYYNAKFGGEQ
jgi:hypothetical protein